jgi:hypothetical protein
LITMTDEEKDYEAFKTYVDLWKSENPIKTNKLQVLLVVNGLLVSTANVAGGFKPENWVLFFAGAVFSFIWLISIGRTSLFQKVWQIKAKKIASKKDYTDDPRFRILNTTAEEKEAPVWLRALGGVPSKYYLLGAPLLFSFLWLAALLYVLIAK